MPEKPISHTLHKLLDRKASELIARANILLAGKNVEITPQAFNELKGEANKVLYLTILKDALRLRKEIVNNMITLMRKKDKQAILFFADILKQTPEFKDYKIKEQGKVKMPREKSYLDLLNKAEEENNETS